MNKLYHNKYYNHPLLKNIIDEKCNIIDRNGKQLIWDGYYSDYIYHIGCLLKNKIKFIYKYDRIGITKINISFVNSLYTFDKNKYIYNDDLKKNNIYKLKIAEILNVKYILKSNDQCIIFYDENKLNSIYFLFIASKVNNILKETKLKEQEIYYFFHGYLNNYSDIYIKKVIKSYYIMNIPKHLGFNKWLKKNYNLKEEFSYKNDYNRRHKFIFSKQNEKYFDNKYENIKKKLMKIYNNSISSSEFDKFYKKQLKNIKDYKFLKKDVIQYLVNNEDIKNFNKYLSDLDAEVKNYTKI